MRIILTVAAIGSILLFGFGFFKKLTGGVVMAQSTRPAIKTTALAQTVDDIDGKPLNLAALKGKVVLVVNVASKCGFTPQYAGLEKLYNTYKDRGLVIIGLPSNDFGGQEPGSESDIKAFCSTTYGVTFPMTAKVKVKGAGKHPFYKALTENTGEFAGEVKWNFTKFVIARDGETLLGRFGSSTKPDDKALVGLIEAELAR